MVVHSFDAKRSRFTNNRFTRNKNSTFFFFFHSLHSLELICSMFRVQHEISLISVQYQFFSRLHYLRMINFHENEHFSCDIRSDEQNIFIAYCLPLLAGFISTSSLLLLLLLISHMQSNSIRFGFQVLLFLLFPFSISFASLISFNKKPIRRMSE